MRRRCFPPPLLSLHGFLFFSLHLSLIPSLFPPPFILSTYAISLPFSYTPFSFQPLLPRSFSLISPTPYPDFISSSSLSSSLPSSFFSFLPFSPFLLSIPSPHFYPLTFSLFYSFSPFFSPPLPPSPPTPTSFLHYLGHLLCAQLYVGTWRPISQEFALSRKTIYPAGKTNMKQTMTNRKSAQRGLHKDLGGAGRASPTRKFLG